MTAQERTTDDFLAAGRAVAPAFGLEVASLELLSHSENVVLAVTATDEQRYAMRLHRPGYNTVDEMESEVEFVDSLRSFGVPVPTCIAVEGGGHYTPVDVRGLAHQVGVIGWVDGAPLGGPLDGGGPGIVGHYGRIGELAAQIRAHHATWVPSAGFARRRWDADGLVGETPIWDRFWEVERLTVDQKALFRAARDQLVDTLGSLPTDASRFGLIHADLHLGNVMASGPDLTVIDFDDCGSGWFVHELAVALHPMLGEDLEAEARASMLAGYRSVHELSNVEEELIDVFLAMRSLMIVGWLAARPEVPISAMFDEIVGDIEQQIRQFMGAA